jgi:hypothetical protein
MWGNLSRTQKFLFIAVMCCVAPFAPEFIFMSQVGGIELVFGFLVLYYKPILLRLQVAIEYIKCELNICITAIKSSLLVQPKVYLTQVLFYSCAFVVSGSMLYAAVFFIPAIMFNGMLV